MEPLPPARKTHFEACASLAALMEDLEFAQCMLDKDDGAQAARAFALGSATVFVDCADRAGFDASVAVGDERGTLCAVIKMKSPLCSFSGTFKTKQSK